MASDELVPWLRYEIRLRLVTARGAMPGTAPISGAWSYDEQARPVPCIKGYGLAGEIGWQSSVPEGAWDCEDPGDDCADIRRRARDAGAHIVANDPRDTIARCEFELALLDEHTFIRVGYRDSAGIDRHSYECAACDPGGPPDSYPCRTVRLLGYAYRFRTGYREEWRP